MQIDLNMVRAIGIISMAIIAAIAITNFASFDNTIRLMERCNSEINKCNNFIQNTCITVFSNSTTKYGVDFDEYNLSIKKG